MRFRSGSVSYADFGAVGDGSNDDGVQIKACHQFANAHGLNVHNPQGEYWIGATRDIPIQTNTYWGSTIFHIDESLTPDIDGQVFTVPTTAGPNVSLGSSNRANVLTSLHKGVQSIYALREWEDHLALFFDSTQIVGIRQGGNAAAGSTLEDMAVVGPGGRLIGDIGWDFADLTSCILIPLNRDRLTIDGGVFLLSGDLTSTVEGTLKTNGFFVSRSRVTFRNQWVGHDDGASDPVGGSTGASLGFYRLRRCYDVVFEDIRNIPRVARTISGVPRGTYGFYFDRTLKATLRNVGGEGGNDSRWGITGNHYLKDLTVENSHLNRIDMHRFGWNLTVRDSTIGSWGFWLVGGGTLFCSNVKVNGERFIEIREDYGSRWDGDIILRDCTLRVPRSAAVAQILQFDPFSDASFGYQIIHGRRIDVDNFTFDFTAEPGSTAVTTPVVFNSYTTIGGETVLYPVRMRVRYTEVGKTGTTAPQSGDTASRPTTDVDGLTYYDTDLDALVWWDQSKGAWVS
jgi:hypothetical protein